MITKVTIEWKNGDRRTFENAEGLQADQVRAARRELSGPDDGAKKSADKAE